VWEFHTRGGTGWKNPFFVFTPCFFRIYGVYLEKKALSSKFYSLFYGSPATGLVSIHQKGE